MYCTSCSQTTGVVQGFNPASCTSNSSTCFTDAACVTYIGPNLSCSGILAGDTLNIILQKIDPLLCASSGDYSTYNTYCLAPVTTQQSFVEKISNFVCQLSSSFTTFTGTTFPAYQTSVTASLNAINNPNITCASAGVISSDTLNSLLTKYCTKFTSIDTALSLSTVNWSSCYTVSPAPTTIAQGFNTLITQICLLQAQVAAATGVPPVFNNTGSCLSGGTTADSLVTTINLIKTQLCETGTINTGALSWGCVTPAAGGNQDLQDTIQNIITLVTTLNQQAPLQWSNDFTVTNVNSGNLCLGKHVALATPSTQDRFVAATASDTSPGTLQQKCTAGTNITLDFTTTPGQMIINSTGGSGTGNNKVLADATDTVADYLENKLEPGAVTNGLSIAIGLDTTNTSHQVSIGVGMDAVTLFTALLNAVSTDPELMTLFCQTVASCPSPCAAPTNVIVTYLAGGTTSTTTTTTTTV